MNKLIRRLNWQIIELKLNLNIKLIFLVADDFYLLWELIGGKEVEAGGVELGADVFVSFFMCLQVSLSRVCEFFYVFVSFMKPNLSWCLKKTEIASKLRSIKLP